MAIGITLSRLNSTSFVRLIHARPLRSMGSEAIVGLDKFVQKESKCGLEICIEKSSGGSNPPPGTN